jgi:SAM-dependent methyltransferase
MVAEYLQITQPLGCALDVGCGAGRSTGALEPLAKMVVGLDPFLTMLTHCHAVAPHACFTVGQAEGLPFPSGTFDIITAAGSLNYANLNFFLPDSARVLTPSGILVIYDFSTGRCFRTSDALSEWFGEFGLRYPFQPGYALDVRSIIYQPFGLRLSAYHEFETAVPLSANAYLEYILSETNVERAITRGVSEGEIHDWCKRSIEAIFGGTVHEVLFRGYIAYVKPDSVFKRMTR